MGSANPMLFAAEVAGLSDYQLYNVIHKITSGSTVSEYEQAALDEAQIRGLLTGSEVIAISPNPVSPKTMV